jgi:hypothetical protein
MGDIGPRLRWSTRGVHLLLLAGVPAEAPGRKGGLKSKKAITDEVMAFCVELGCFVGLRLHHPVIVGRLMPTLIRTRDVAARNIPIDYRRSPPDCQRIRLDNTDSTAHRFD